MNRQSECYEWFSENLKTLYSQYPNKFLVISDSKLCYSADTFDNALEYALKNMKAGDFIIQQCCEIEKTAYYFNKAVVFA